MNAQPLPHTFLWHDYETFGADTRRDRPAQFAAIRTDSQLNEIGEPLMMYCKPAPDYLPSPEACLITGITPQECLEKGVDEHAFAEQIEAAFAKPGTIGVGYNTIRFDDEITRFMFWRNLIDPYAREWQNGCGRWDLLDVVRLTYALRPDGIVWPTKEDGKPSFKLEDLSRANGLLHESAHDALSDVRATIALARLIRDKNPKLFDFAFGLHNKARVANELSVPAERASAKPFLHVSGMYPTDRGCLAVLLPLGAHPTNKNEIIAWDLAHDPRELIGLDAETIRTRIFTKNEDMPEGMARLPVRSVHLNKSPMVVGNLKTLSPEMSAKWGIDLEAVMQNAEIARALPDMSQTWSKVYHRTHEEAESVDEDLYNGFLSNADRRRLNSLRNMTPEKLALDRTHFDDDRLSALVFRYRARNWPHTLSPEHAGQWQDLCAFRLINGGEGVRSIEALQTEIDALSENTDERGETILGALYDYAEAIAPEPANAASPRPKAN